MNEYSAFSHDKIFVMQILGTIMACVKCGPVDEGIKRNIIENIENNLKKFFCQSLPLSFSSRMIKFGWAFLK
jgi:hypothetical protein